MPIQKRSLASVALIAMIALAGCNKPEGDGKVLATVNGTAITQKDLELSTRPSGHSPGGAAKDLDYLIGEELMYQQGKRIGLDRDPTYQKQRARLEQSGHGMAKNSPEHVRSVANEMRSEMAQRVFSTQIAARAEVRMAEAKEYFERNRQTIGTQLHLGLIKLQSRQDAQKALQRISQGEKFEAVARQAKGKTVQTASPDLGFLSWTEIPIDFVEPLYKLKPGEVSGILGNQQAGFQIVKVYETRPSPKPPQFADVSGSIMNGLRDLKIVQLHHQYLGQLKKEAKIVTF